MLKIFRQLAHHWVVCLAIAALLIVQATCDLALPGFTSDIVDVGIQQGGVESSIPDSVRADTLQSLQALMSPQDAEFVESWYGAADANGVRTLSDSAVSAQAELEKAFTLPDVALYMAAAQSSASSSGGGAGSAPSVQDLNTAINAIRSAVKMTDSSSLSSQLASALSDKEGGTTSQDMMKGQAILLVRLEYEAQGIAETIQMNYLWRKGAQMLGYSLLMVAVAVLVGYLAARTSASIGQELRQQVFKRVVSFSSAETDRFSTASLITRTTNDVQQVQMTSMMLLRMVAYAPILAVGGIFRVSQTKTGLSWIIVVAVAVLLSIVLVLMKIALPKFRLMQSLVDRLNLVSREILTGIMPIRAFSREEYEEKRFDNASTDLMQTQLFTNRVMTFMMPLMMLMMNVITLMIVWFGAKQIDAAAMQVGDLIAFITYTMQIVMSFLMLTGVSIMLPRAGVAAERIDEVCRTEPSIEDPAADMVQTKQHWQGVVEFHNVNFRYPGADTDALEHLSFIAKPGETTAIIGATGCGKSTLLNLIPRFYDVSAGSVTIDGVDIRNMPQNELHALLGYVPQKGVLFSGTIASNLKFGGPQISNEDMKQAADIAQASDFISEKEEGFDSPIAQGGSNVSGGQKQRLAIARAIAKKPRIYLFDDSFSALDYKTDVALRRALKAQTENTTVIIVAQRISTVLHANRILVLDDGKIVGSGTHSQLMENCPEYQEIAKSQLSQKELSGSIVEAKEGEQ